MILGLARGGVLVAAEVARLLHRPLDVIVVRKIGAQGNPEVAIGAVGEDGHAVINDAAVRALRVSAAYLSDSIEVARTTIRRRVRAYRQDGPPDLRGMTAVVVDDGIATGETMETGVQTVRRWGAAHVIVAAPVAAPESIARFRSLVDDVVVLEAPPLFFAVGQAYIAFTQVDDDEVRAALGTPVVALAGATGGRPPHA